MKFFRFLGYAVAALVVVVAGAATTVYFVSNAKLTRTFDVTPRPLAIPSDAAAIARGGHIARTRGCVDCHGSDFAGGKVIDDGAMGRIHGPNLTRGRGSRTGAFTDTDWVRAIRHGVGPDKKGLFVMPAEEYAHFSDEDLANVIAYMKSLPAIDRDSVPKSYGPVTRVLLTLGKMRMPATAVDHSHAGPVSVVKAPNAEYGRYLANGCIGCHGPNFSGGKIEIGPPNWPMAANLTPHESANLPRWTELDFIRAIRDARRPDGTELNPVMPRGFGGMDDVELRALYAFFKSLPAAPLGAR